MLDIWSKYLSSNFIYDQEFIQCLCPGNKRWNYSMKNGKTGLLKTVMPNGILQEIKFRELFIVLTNSTF